MEFRLKRDKLYKISRDLDIADAHELLANKGEDSDLIEDKIDEETTNRKTDMK